MLSGWIDSNWSEHWPGTHQFIFWNLAEHCTCLFVCRIRKLLLISWREYLRYRRPMEPVMLSWERSNFTLSSDWLCRKICQYTVDSLYWLISDNFQRALSEMPREIW